VKEELPTGSHPTDEDFARRREALYLIVYC